MIDYLIEIVFKNVDFEEIGSLLMDLIYDNQNILRYNFTCNCCDVNWNNGDFIKEVFIKNDNFGLFINIKKLNRSEMDLQNCGIVVYKQANKIDLEINFQLSDLKNSNNKNLIKNLMQLAKSIAVQYQIADYFCGLEPAQEADTRLFTNEQLGPFSIERLNP